MSEYIPVMIVEDEKFILEDLTTIVSWEQLGFKIVATAVNGEQGLKMFEKFSPQLILTDIKMPVFDGLAMMKSIKQFNTSIQFIIISSYSDFEYAQTALRLGASDYILKSDISSDYIKEKLIAVKKNLLNSNELYLNLYCKMLEELIFSEHAATPEDINILFDRISEPELKKNMSTYISRSIKILSKAVHALFPEIEMDPPEAETISALKNWLYAKITFLQENNKLYFEKKLSPVLINAYNYISDHYSDPNLRINQIADAVGLSSSRLSVLCKQEIGQTVNEVITAKRIERAKYLLRWKKLKVYEVAECVGYKTSQYFSKIFYQYTGQYPNNYREENI